MVERVIKVILRSNDFKRKQTAPNLFSVSHKNIVLELLQVESLDLQRVTILLESMFFLFHSNLSYFLIVDKLSSLKNGVSLNYVSEFFYYLKMIIQILFDHDTKLQEFNLQNTEVTEPSS